MNSLVLLKELQKMRAFWILISLAVHSSGAIRPATTKDSQTKCGSVLCQKVDELFSPSKLNYGYNYVTTIPSGAMNMSVKQMSKSNNLIALKTMDDNYIINGNNRISEGGTYEYNEDVYDYNKDLSMITSKGPLTKPVVLLLLVRGLNPGLKYSYTLPVPSAALTESEDVQSQWNELGQPLDEIDFNNIDSPQILRLRDRRRRKFSWKLLGFGQCSRSCGPGVQTPIFRCIRDSPTRYYSPKRCAFVEKPVFSEDIYHCNRGLCPAFWRPGDFDECQCDDKAEEGVRKRHVHCVQEQITGQIEEVDESLCADEKLPELMETCSCPQVLRRKIYARTPDKATKVYSRLIGSSTVSRNVTRKSSKSKTSPNSVPTNVPSDLSTGSAKRQLNTTSTLRRYHREDRFDKAGVWLMSEWNQLCSTDCSLDFEQRTIYCDRTAPYSDLCDIRSTPEQKRPCTVRSQTCRLGSWFTSAWSNCTGDCFNLQRKRRVLCLRDGHVVDDNQCPAATRPADVRNCPQKDVDFCGPKWHYSDWSECSRSCGEGVQRRYAKCLEFDWKQNAMVESNQCKYLEREPVYGACNAIKCEELSHDPLDVMQNDNAATPTKPQNCSDEFSNCKRINRERLCKFDYYSTYCCLTCHGYYRR